MKNGDTVVIRQVGNGFVVEPLGPPHIAMPVADVLVFNEMGYAISPGNAMLQPCLLKFIETHFSQGKRDE